MNFTRLIIIISYFGICTSSIAQKRNYDFTVASDGAWTWFNDERALIKNGKLYTSYVKSDGHTAISVYSIATDETQGEEVNLSSWTESDDHNNASLLFNKEGKLMAFYSKHHTNAFTNHRTSFVEQPTKASHWGPEVTVSSGANHTYNNAFQLSDMDNTIFNFSRTNGYNPNMKKYHADGSEMTPDIELIRSGDDKTRPYVKYASNSRNRIEFFFTDGHPRKTDNNLYHMYYEDGNLYQTNGDFIINEKDLPVSVDQVNKLYSFGDMSPTARPWTCSFNYSKEGLPVVTYSLQEDKYNIQYYYAWWDADQQEWIHHYIADAGDALYDAERDYTGLVAINPYDVNEIYMSANVNPLSGQQTKHYEIYQGVTTDKGESFGWTALTQGSDEDNLRPFVPKGAVDDNQVLLWLQGTYRTYQDFDTKVVGRYINKSGELDYAQQESYSSLSSDWKFENPKLWKNDGSILSLMKAGKQDWSIRRPGAVATLATTNTISSFRLSADIRSTEEVINHGRDLIIVWGYQSPTQFYYAHLSNDNSIMPHNGIFLVDGSDRKRIDHQGVAGAPEERLADKAWHQVVVHRNTKTGDIAVFLDDVTTPLLTATDFSILEGHVGFGSFDNIGEIKNLVIYPGVDGFVKIDDFDGYRNGNVNGQGQWAAGPPGATDGGRVSALIPDLMTGQAYENNADGIQYRGNATRNLVGFEFAEDETHTLYFECAIDDGFGTDFIVGFSDLGAPPFQTQKFEELQLSYGIHFKDRRFVPFLGSRDPQTSGSMQSKRTYQFWMVMDPLKERLEVYSKEKSDNSSPSLVTIQKTGKQLIAPFKSLVIYNNPEDVPTANTYLDNFFMSRGTNTQVPSFDIARADKKATDVVPITNPFEATIQEGALKLKMVEVATIPRSADGDVAARINNLTHSNDGTGRLFVNDLRNNLYLLQSGEVSIYMKYKDYFKDFVDQPRQNSGFGYVAFHPEFATNGLFYTTHTEANNALTTKTPDYKTGLKAKVHGVIEEWKAKDPKADVFVGTHREVLRVGMSTLLHGIQALNFNPTAKPGDEDYGLLFISIGDGEENPRQTTRPQSLSGHEAKILRIDPTGANSVNRQYGIPPSNPFINVPDALPEIYCMGIRNPHRMMWDPMDGKMFFSMIGENQIDAIYEGIKGANYGWNEREGSFVFDRDSPSYVAALPEDDNIYNYTYPIIQTDHDDSKALIGGYVYRGSEIPDLYGKYIFGDLVYGPLYYAEVKDMITGKPQPLVQRAKLFNEKGEKTTFVKEVSHYYRADLKFGQDEKGEIYLLSKTNGKVYKLQAMD